MSKLYLPTDYVNSSCKVVNNGYIRAYTNNNLTEYVDIYVNQNYMLKEGYSNFSYTGLCDSLNEYTDNVYYRNDFSSICIMFMTFCVICLYLPIRAFSKLFKRGVL